MKLTGKIALVTGASRGVGQATAVELARRGADVILAARTVADPIPGQPGTLTETAELVRAEGREALLVQADLNDMASVENLATEALAWRDSTLAYDRAKVDATAQIRNAAPWLGDIWRDDTYEGRRAEVRVNGPDSITLQIRGMDTAVALAVLRAYGLATDPTT